MLRGGGREDADRLACGAAEDLAAWSTGASEIGAGWVALLRDDGAARRDGMRVWVRFGGFGGFGDCADPAEWPGGAAPRLLAYRRYACFCVAVVAA